MQLGRWSYGSAGLLWLVVMLLGWPKPIVGANQTAKSNVLVIVSDDHGYADVGFQGGKDVPTPSLDALARSGVRCTSGYASHPFCSPTRAGLMTGRYQARFGHEFNPVYDPLDEKEGLPLGERLLPEFVRGAGYATGWVGKWHLGSSPAHCPWKRGFDETFGFIGGGHRFHSWEPNERQYTLPLTRNGQSLDTVPPHLTTAFGNEASAFIRRHQGQPWLLYVAFNAPHTPHEPTAEREARFAHIEDAARRRYLAQVSLLDDAIGDIQAALEDSGQRDRTLVFFFSDNGGPTRNAANNGPLRGQKGQVYEGGVRVPFLVSLPGKLPAGGVYDHPVSSLDVLATSLGLAGVPMPENKKYDSVNLLPYLEGEKTTAPHERLCWRAMEGKARAVREGEWKLVRMDGQADELYQLTDDIGESKNLAAEQPQVAAKLAAALEDWERALIAPVFLGSSVKSEDWGPGGANQKASAKAKKNGPAK
jgi:arylsulfatase A-like enzyme